VSGWAVDLNAPSGTGVDVVHVWAMPAGGGAPVFLGAAQYGIDRPDVAAFFHTTEALKSGFTLMVTGLAPGTYQIVAYARSTVTGQFDGTLPRQVVVDTSSRAPGR